jgi:putative Mg2+ transporter-C (MgtC) family protein
MVLAFGEPSGQGWTQVLELVIAFGLSLLIGFERQVQQKSAGLRTYTLVGLGSALFVLVSKYGFTDVLGPHVILDPSRVAAQIVSGLGFIGGGLIFLRRDTVRGLTTAASIWLTAAVGAAAGAGLPLLAGLTCLLYFLLMYGLRPVARLADRFRPNVFGLHVTYLDGRGLLRDIINDTTQHGFSIEEVTTVRSGETDADSEGQQQQATVEVSLVLAGRGSLTALTATLTARHGILSVRTGGATEE